MRAGVIVGIDPGTTTASAKLDLQGNLVGLKSKKGFSQKELEIYIIEGGVQPVLIAVDVAKVPASVGKLAAAFNVNVEKPIKDLKRSEKNETATGFLKKYNKKAKNFHEVSALTAAIVCFKKYENKFRQVERQLREKGVFTRVEEVKREVICGRSVARVLEGRP